MDILDSEAQLRSKKELIEKFIAENLQGIPKDGDVGEEFESFWSAEKEKAIQVLGEEEGLEHSRLQQLIGDYIFTEKPPMRDDVISIMQTRPSLKDRKPIAERVIGRIKDFVQTFIDGVD